MKWLVAPSALILTQTCNEGHLTLTTRVSYPITGELFPVHLNIHVSFPFSVSSKLELNLHLRHVTISLKTIANLLNISIIANRVCPHKRQMSLYFIESNASAYRNPNMRSDSVLKWRLSRFGVRPLAGTTR